MNNNRKNEITAFLITLLLTGGTVLVMVNSYLHFVWPPQEQVMLQQDSIMFGGEFVMLGNMPDPTQSDEMDAEALAPSDVTADLPDVAGDDMDDAGPAAQEPTRLVTATRESPMKVKEKPKEEKPKKTGPAVAKNEDSKQEKVKRGKETATQTDRVASAFGKSAGKGSGKQGSPDGNSDVGATVGKPGIGGLVGYTLEYWARPHSKWVGTVTVRVRVSNRGKVLEAHAINATGELASHAEVKRDCEEKALKSAFSVPKNTTTEGIGTITYRFI